MYVFILLVKVTEWPPIGKIAAHSAYDMFHGISTLLLVWLFPTSVFGVGILIAPFPDLCLLVPFYMGKSEYYGFFENYCSLRPEKW